MRQRIKKKNAITVKRIIGTLLIMTSVIIGIAIYKIESDGIEEKEAAEQTYDDIKEKAITIKIKTASETDSTSNDIIESDTEEYVIDWEVFSGYNVVGWIKMGEYIDYPIMQNKESNKYYLYKTYDDKYNANGSIFMGYTNNSDFMDLNTIIYGHNMGRNSTIMFGSLKKLLEDNESNPKTFDIYLPDGTKHTYEVFSVNKVKDLGYAYNTQFGSIDDFISHKQKLINESQYNCGIKATENKTVMLSTCDDIGSSKGNRVVVVGQEKEVKQIQEPASWCKKNKYIEVSNKKAKLSKGNNYYYIIQNNLAIRTREDIVNKIIINEEKEVIVRVMYEETGEAFQYTDLNNKKNIYPIIDIIDYVIE